MSPSRAGRDIIVLSLEAWDQVWRRNQYFAAGLLRADPAVRILFVEPPADPLYALARRVRPDWPRGLRSAPPITGVEPGRCWLYQPTKLLPRKLDRHLDLRRAAAVLRAARRIDFVRPTIWFNDPSTAALLDLTQLPSLYDITDDWLAADRPADEHQRLIRDEHSLLTRCTEVTVCSPALAVSKGADRPVTLITNGVDVERYRAPTDRPADLPSGPTAVYVGTLHSDRLDIDLCVRAAQALGSGGTVVLVGPVALTPAETDRLTQGGVVLLGPRPFTEVPGYLQHADILIVPHVVDPFTDSLDPIKLYEYRSVGRPVLSTAVAGFRDRADEQILLADGADFVQAAGDLLRGPRRETVAPVADLPSWAGQVDAFRQSLDRAARWTDARSR